MWDTYRELSDRNELSSTLGALFISALSCGLHLWFASMMTTDYFGEHHLYWAFLVLSALANLVGVLLFIAQGPPGGARVGGEFELSRRLQEYPEQCALCMFFGLVSAESLVFITSSTEQRRRFRVQALGTALLEDVPFVCLLVRFLVLEEASLAVYIVLGVTVVAFCVKGLRAALLLCESAVASAPARTPLLRNLRLEDLMLLPVHLLQWVLVVTLLVWLAFGAWNSGFERAWTTRQLESLGSFHAPLAINASVRPGYLDGIGRVNLSAVLLGLDGSPANATAAAAAAAEPLELGALAALLQADPAAAAVYLTPAATAFAAEFGSLRSRLESCVYAGIAFLAAGMVATVGLLVAYLRHPSLVSSFGSEEIFRRSLLSAGVASIGLLDPAMLNGISQDARGYSLVKRDSAALLIAFYGLPAIGVAAAALAAFDCQHRACDVAIGSSGSNIEYYTIFALMVAVPLLWWHVLSLLTAIVALRATDSADPDSDAYAGGKGDGGAPLEGEALDAEYPPAADNGTWLKWVGYVVSLAYSAATWLLQLLFLFALYWNSPLATRTVGGRSAHEWGAEHAPRSSAAIDLGSSAPQTRTEYRLDGDNQTVAVAVPLVPTPPWQPSLPPSYFQMATAFWVLAIVLNAVAVGVFMARAATPALRRSVSRQFAVTAGLFTLSAITPEAMRPLADRRSDAMALRLLGVVPAWALDFPLLVTALAVLGRYGYHPFVFVVALTTGVHLILYTYRAVLVRVTHGFTRHPVPYEQRPTRVSAADAVVMLATALHLGLMFTLLGLYLHGFYYGPSLGMATDAASFLRVAFWALLALLSVSTLSNTGVALSFLNHWVYTDCTVPEHSWRSTGVLLLSSLDASWLNLLSTDEAHVRDVKRVANLVSLVVLFAPTLLLQAAVVFMADIDWGYLDNSDHADLIPGTATQNAGFAFSIIIGVCKMVVLTYQHTAQREAQRDAQSRGEHIPILFRHCPPWSRQWALNQMPPADYVDPSARGPSPFGRTVTGARHYMGYAISEEGDWIFDDNGDYMLADGVSYAVDEHTGQYVLDADGNYVLEGLAEPDPADGDSYWHSYYGNNDENVTNTSRSTDTFTAASDSRYGGSNYGYEASGAALGGGYAARAEMLQVTISRKSLYESPDAPGMHGFFVQVPATAERRTPYLYVQAHEVVPAARKGGRLAAAKGAQLVTVTFLSLDAGGLDRDYIEAHVAPDPDVAWQALQAYDDDGGLAVDADAYDYRAGGSGYAGQQGSTGYSGAARAAYGGGAPDVSAYSCDALHGYYADQPLPPDEDPNTAQRL